MSTPARLARSDEVARIQQKYTQLQPVLNERTRRLWAAAEADSLGHGGITLVAEATGLGRPMIRRGLADLRALDGSDPVPQATPRIRRPGGGRKPLTETDPTLLPDLDALVDPATRGDPESPLRWSSKSTEHLAAALRNKGHRVSADTVGRLLAAQNYSLQGLRKSREGNDHPDRDAQFQHIHDEVVRFQAMGQPVISVDTKKKELVGNFKNGGQEWQKKGGPVKVEAYDFPSLADFKAIPYGIYDLTRNEGWVNVGIDHDTSEFAVASIERWWTEVGRVAYPDATDLLITADSGGSNNPRYWLWKRELQAFADRSGLTVSACHFPPGTSKWNKIEHRLFCHLTHNWRGRPLTSLAVIISLIGATTTQQGLTVQASLDKGKYPDGIKVSKEEREALKVVRDAFHGEWNYTFLPRDR